MDFEEGKLKLIANSMRQKRMIAKDMIQSWLHRKYQYKNTGYGRIRMRFSLCEVKYRVQVCFLSYFQFVYLNLIRHNFRF